MRQVWVLRHANRNIGEDTLTEEGRKKCVDLKERIVSFDIIISSPFDRTKETARLLTGVESSVDERAGTLTLTKEQNDKITVLRKEHPLGVAGAIFSIPELIESVKEAGQHLSDLIRETIQKLPMNGKALIISHDGTMVSAEKILKKESFATLEKTYNELEGFVIDENLKISSFEP